MCDTGLSPIFAENFIFLAKNRNMLSSFFFLPMQRLMSFLPNYGISIQIHLNLGQKRTKISLLTFCGHSLCMQYLSIIRMTNFFAWFFATFKMSRSICKFYSFLVVRTINSQNALGAKQQIWRFFSSGHYLLYNSGRWVEPNNHPSIT